MNKTECKFLRKIIHIDMDCFYAAIEIRDNPSLHDKPVAVGGSPQSRGVVCTSNYLARQYGIHSAMSSAYAKRLCPNLIILPVNMEKYRAVSKIIRSIFFQYTELVEPLSLDEAYLDVTHCDRCCNSATLMAKEIRAKIFDACQLTASAGIAPNKFLAKVASEINKPDGQYVIKPEDIPTFIKTLPVKKIFGVGKVTAKKLETMGIRTCHDLQSKTKIELIDAFGKFGSRLHALSRGIDKRQVQPSRLSKSLSVETTFESDLTSITTCINELLTLYDRLQKRLKNKASYSIHKQFIKIKFNNFKITTVESITDNLSIELFKQLINIGYQRKNRPIRLLGIGVGFKPSSESAQQAFDIFSSTSV